MKVNEIFQDCICTNGDGLYRQVTDYTCDVGDVWIVRYEKVAYLPQKNSIHRISKGTCSLETLAKWSKFIYRSEEDFIGAQWIIYMADKHGSYREDLSMVSDAVKKIEKGGITI